MDETGLTVLKCRAKVLSFNNPQDHIESEREMNCNGSKLNVSEARVQRLNKLPKMEKHHCSNDISLHCSVCVRFLRLRAVTGQVPPSGTLLPVALISRDPTRSHLTNHFHLSVG